MVCHSSDATSVSLFLFLCIFLLSYFILVTYYIFIHKKRGLSYYPRPPQLHHRCHSIHTTTVLQSSPEAYTTINYSYPHPTIYLSMHEGGREEVLCITEHCNIACVPSQSPPTCVHTWVSGVSGRVQSKGIGVTPS